jgi:hypothetical protein
MWAVIRQMRLPQDLYAGDILIMAKLKLRTSLLKLFQWATNMPVE